MHGKGVLIVANGDKYEVRKKAREKLNGKGNFHNGKVQGFGTYSFSTGVVHKGIFENGQMVSGEVVDNKGKPVPRRNVPSMRGIPPLNVKQ